MLNPPCGTYRDHPFTAKTYKQSAIPAPTPNETGFRPQLIGWRSIMNTFPSWSFLSSLRIPSDLLPDAQQWQVFRRWIDHAEKELVGFQRRFDQLRIQWEAKLGPLGGDPSTRNWGSFRPLRLSREEDWSDWLAHLIQESRTGEFSRYLFDAQGNSDPLDFADPLVQRESLTDTGNRRADLLIEWNNDRASHVEVKVGDQAFEKTFATGEGLRKKFQGSRVWSDYILLPESSLAEWHECEGTSVRSIQVFPILWKDVAISIRRCLWRETEDLSWRTWALAFCGAIEQTILGIPCALKETGHYGALGQSEWILDALAIFEKGKH